MTQFTTAQQLEIAEFFQHLVAAEIDFTVNYTAARTATELCKAIRMHNDDYEDIFERMQQHSVTMNNIVDAYWTARLGTA